MSADTLPRIDAKALGAYYTDEQVADFLVRWAIRKPDDTLLDPSFGGGVFLRASVARIRELSGHPASQVYGVELDDAAFASAKCMASVRKGDFFDFAAVAAPHNLRHLPTFDAIVGNPPFIRYQRFAGSARRKGLRRATEQGVVLSQLTSSWAPFIVHSVSMLKHGGRLAMVVPYEIVHARYAKPVLSFLSAQFPEVTLLTFEEPLFPMINESTVLLLANGKGEGSTNRLSIRHFVSADGLTSAPVSTADIDVRAVIADKQRFSALHLPFEYRDLYAAAREFCAELGDIADIGIGYVTGANDFFHVTPEAKRLYQLPRSSLAKVVCRGSAFHGAVITDADWRAGLESGASSYLLTLDSAVVSDSLQRYLDYGTSLGVPQRYKCRSRKPWYRVPNVYKADAFLTYMSGARPRLVANDAGLYAPNTLHVLRLRHTSFTAHAVAVAWQSSISRLSSEIEGHAMGGGMLKLEPREAARVLIPADIDVADMETFTAEVDRLLRDGKEEAARHLVDEVTLRKRGFAAKDCVRLADAARMLQQRRCRIAPNATERNVDSRRTVGSRFRPE